MVWAFLLDTSLRLLRPHERFPDRSYFDLLKLLASTFLQRLSQSVPDQCSTVVRSLNSTSEHELCVFSSDVPVLQAALSTIDEPSPIRMRDLEKSVVWALNEIYKYWGSSEHVQVLLFTDGRASIFDLPASNETPSPCGQWPNATLLFVSLTDDKIPQDLIRLHEKFLPNSVIIPLKCQQKSVTLSFEELIDECTTAAIHRCLAECGLNHVPEVSVRCGHMHSLIQLTPFLRTGRRSEPSSKPESLCLEIFGFLNTSDLSNPPVASRHSVNSSSARDAASFLLLLFTAMQESKTVAMCSIYLTDGDESKPSGVNKHLWRHGFLHPFDTKVSVLMLSVFPADCSGLPWIGQFRHLAPVEDFAGVQLYDDREGISPFPVLVPDRLSYGALSYMGPSVRTTAPDLDAFRYVSWASPSALLADVNKLLRLGRRLPEKSHLFFKELVRVRSAALAYGCPDLLAEVARLTEATHAAELQTNSANSQAIQTHLNTMRRMLEQTTPEITY